VSQSTSLASAELVGGFIMDATIAFTIAHCDVAFHSS
jgi:hypothetical protein